MDTASTTSIPAITARDLFARMGGANAPLIFDVRRAPAYEADTRLIASALRVSPDDVLSLPAALTQNREIVVYCVHGHEVSQTAARQLRDMGRNASYLEGGMAGWVADSLATIAKQTSLGVAATPDAPTRWVTRERPKVDRIACPWLVRRFIDPTAEFLYVPSNEVLDVAARENAIPYDVPNVRFTHRGAEDELCSFDALVADFEIDDPCVHDLARIVRGADTGKPGLTPQSAGLLALSLGLSSTHADDHAMLEQGMIMYDALYAWVKSAGNEVHNADLFHKG